MHRRLPVLLFTILAAVALWRMPAAKDPKVGEADDHRPTLIPDRVILTWAGDPASSAAVTWRTSVEVTRPVAQIAEAEDGPGFVKKARTVPVTSERLKTDLSEASYHSAVFDSLQPGRQYVYRVGDGFNWSEWNQFRTAEAGVAPLSFIYVGDAQNDIYSLWSRLIRQGFMEAGKPHFLIHAGDLINRAERDAEWGEWHRAAGWINRSVVSFPVPGNHEYGRMVGNSKTITANWRPQFTLPENGVKGLEETNYYVDVQGVRMVALDSNRMQKEQAEWLDGLLSKNPNRWTILTFHHPIYSTAKGRDNKELRETWQPVFDKHRVDLVLTGHDHSYGRTNLVTGAGARRGKAGTVYVVSVSGPKMYNVAPRPEMARMAEDTQLCQIIRIDGDRLSFEARTARGALYDAFDLIKVRGRANRLVSKAPRTPERRKAPEGSASGG